jgi:predicted ribosome quality control (RQC) complex YloA/Tae2 family protein
MEFITDNTTDEYRAFLTSEQLDYAEKLGISAKRAYWLASCPKNTRSGSKDRPPTTFNRFDPERSYLYKQPGGNYYYFRLKRVDVFIMRKLSKDFEKAKKMRDAIILQMNLTLKK